LFFFAICNATSSFELFFGAVEQAANAAERAMSDISDLQ
jgi:hypothetical protein